MRNMTFTETETPNLLALHDHLTETRGRAYAVAMAATSLSLDDESSALQWIAFDAHRFIKTGIDMLETIREADSKRRSGEGDAMLATVTEYQTQLAIFAAIPEGELTAANEAEHVARTYGPASDALDKGPAVTSTAGAIAALRFAKAHPDFYQGAMMAAVLDFLDRDPA